MVKKIGVCIDNDVAYLLEEKNEENVITIIHANNYAIKEEEEEEEEKQKDARTATPKRSINEFYKEVCDIVKHFDRISLFGPAETKNKLINRLRKNKLSGIEILSNPIDEKITDNQKIEFINNYFSA